MVRRFRDRRRIAREHLLVLLSLLLAAPGCRGQSKSQDHRPGEGPAEPPRSFTGMFSLDADGQARFTACHTRTMVPVAKSGGWAALKNAYQDWRTAPGEQLLITATGRIAVPEAAEEDAGALETPHLIIDEFTGIWPGETCGRPGATSQLENMYWRLTRLEGKPVRVRQEGREPHLVFHTEERRLAGSTGCNRLDGSYELDGQGLGIGSVATTKMLCPDLQDQERAMLSALARVAAWRLEGQHLELLDAEGAVLLRLEERALTH